MYKIYSKLLFNKSVGPQSFRLLHGIQNHYEILNLNQNCTDKEIRDAFVKLSKECHPDTSKSLNKQSTCKFQQILEAYRILSKIDSRTAYDLDLATHQVINRPTYKTYTVHNKPQDVRDYYAPWKHYGTTTSSEPYYGIQGLKRLPNVIIVLAIFAIIGFGVSFQIYLIRHSMTLKRDRLITISQLSNETYTKVRQNAMAHSNEQQLERIRDIPMNHFYQNDKSN